MLFNRSLAQKFFYITLLTGVAGIFYFYQYLPDTIAVHFGFSGEADRTSGREVFIYINLSVFMFIFGVFFLIDWLMPKLPESSFNLPNKKYWLAPERKEETLKMNSAILYWIGGLTNLFLFLMVYSIYESNIPKTPQLSSGFWLYMLLYLVAIFYVVYKMYKRFNKIPEENETKN